MVACSLIECGARKSQNQSSLSLHRFPVNEVLRKKWLEIIGSENINPGHKNWYLCSLHFEATCFNKTLNVIRLNDGAVPSSTLLPGRSCQVESTSNILISGTNKIFDLKKTEPCLVEPVVVDNADNGDARLIQQQSKQIDILTRKCKYLQKKIKRLNEKVRRRDIKIALSSTIIKDLQRRKFVNNEESFILVECAGSEDFLNKDEK